MNRGITNIIRYVMDECIPPVIRDSRWFMYPFFWYWFKGKNISLFMDFKRKAWELSEAEFASCYEQLDCRATDRATDLNQPCIDLMLKELHPEATSLLDVGCGRGYWLRLLKSKTKLDLTGTDVFDPTDVEGIVYQKGSIEKLPFPDNSFDIVTCHHTIEHLRNIDQGIAELKRIAKKQLIIVTPRQRYFYYTLDLHLHFFPEKTYLLNLVNLKEAKCIDCKGDWCYIATL